MRNYLTQPNQLLLPITQQEITQKLQYGLDLLQTNQPLHVLSNRSRTVLLNDKIVLDFNNLKFKKVGRYKRLYVYIMQVIIDLIVNEKTMTKRELFYQNVSLFHDQSRCDSVLLEITNSLGVDRSQLHITASYKGLVYGPLHFILKDESVLDASLRPVSIPTKNEISRLETGASWYLVVEKDATFQSFIQEGFQSKCPHAILITGKGFSSTLMGRYPDIATRELVVALSKLDRIPVQIDDLEFWTDTDQDGLQELWMSDDENEFDGWWFPNLDFLDEECPIGLEDLKTPNIWGYILMDGDPDGVEIMLTYRQGSIIQASNSERYACPQLEWIGMKPSQVDVALVGMWDRNVIGLSHRDRIKILSMITRLSSSEMVKRELSIMLHHGIKSEIELYSNHAILQALAK